MLTCNGFILVVASLFSGFAGHASGQTVWYVDDDAPPGGDGRSWSSAFQNPDDALAVAVARDEVWVAEGRYVPADLTNGFQLVGEVGFFGGFRGDEQSRAEAQPALHPTILSGDVNGDDEPGFVNYQDNTLTVASLLRQDELTTIDGFEFSGGNGGHLDLEGGTGGGLAIWNSAAAISRCAFRRNRATLYGGGLGIYVLERGTTIDRCVFEDNLIDPHGSSNTSSGAGLSVHGSTGEISLTQCRFKGNIADFGGGVACGGVTMLDCEFLENEARIDGGGLILWMIPRGGIRIGRCYFGRNVAGRDGGGIGIGGFQVGAFIHDCRLIANHAGGSGGGFANTRTSWDIHLVNTVIYGNTAHQTGGALIDGRGGWVSSCILWGNRDDLGGSQAQIDWSPITPVIRYSCIQDYDRNVGEGIITDDPRVVDPDGPDNILGTPDDDFRLQADSPCIDAGTNLGLRDETEFEIDDGNFIDADLAPRFMDVRNVPDTGDGFEAIVDIGAYERPGVPMIQMSEVEPGNWGQRNGLRITGLFPGERVLVFGQIGEDLVLADLPGCNQTAWVLRRPTFLGQTTADAGGSATLVVELASRNDRFDVAVQVAAPDRCYPSRFVSFRIWPE